jgi:uncharacterized protein YeaO (DUF488 family)
MIKIKRIYDPPAVDDGHRILVDRLWPRGVAKATARIDEWLKELAPSNELRSWFGHDPSRWEEFRERYRAELAGQQPLLDRLKEMARTETVTLLFAAQERTYNNAVVLRDLLSD